MSGFIPANNYQNYTIPQPKKTGLYLATGLATGATVAAAYGVDKYVKSATADGKETFVTKKYSSLKTTIVENIAKAKTKIAEFLAKDTKPANIANKVVGQFKKVKNFANALPKPLKYATLAALAFIGYESIKKSGEIDGVYKTQSQLL